MDSTESEACGRCAMTSVVNMEDQDADEDSERDERGGYDPFSGAHIELNDNELRIASAPAVAAGQVKRRLNELATRLVYGR
jgi:hypothetical protein